MATTSMWRRKPRRARVRSRASPMVLESVAPMPCDSPCATTLSRTGTLTLMCVLAPLTLTHLLALSLSVCLCCQQLQPLSTCSPNVNHALAQIGRVEAFRAFCNKMWNATKFVLMQLGEGFAPAPFSEVAHAGPQRHKMEQWILSRLNAAIIQSNEGLTHYHFSKVVALVCACSLVTNHYSSYGVRRMIHRALQRAMASGSTSFATFSSSAPSP